MRKINSKWSQKGKFQVKVSFINVFEDNFPKDKSLFQCKQIIHLFHYVEKNKHRIPSDGNLIDEL